MNPKIGRNDPCSCCSGKKYKKCCLQKDEEKMRTSGQTTKLAASRKDHYDNGYFDDLHEPEPASDSDEETDQDVVAENYNPSENHEYKHFDKTFPKIGKEGKKFIDDWYAEYKHVKRKAEGNPLIIMDHIRQSLDQRPDLAINFDLADILFNLEDDCLKNNKYDEFVNFLYWYRYNHRPSYDFAAPYLDHMLIAHNLVRGKKEDIPELFSFYKSYPDENPDCLLQVVDLLLAADEEALIFKLLDSIYIDIFYSPNVIGSDDFVSPILVYTYGKHLQKNKNDVDIEALLYDVSDLANKVSGMGINTHREFWRDFLDNMYDKQPMSAFPANRKEIKDYYWNVSLRFTLFLREVKNLSWIGATHLSEVVGGFLMMPLSDKKRPKMPFKFTADLIEKHIMKSHRDMFGIKAINSVSFLRALYFFAEYLASENMFSPQERKHAEDTDFQKTCLLFLDGASFQTSFLFSQASW